MNDLLSDYFKKSTYFGEFDLEDDFICLKFNLNYKYTFRVKLDNLFLKIHKELDYDKYCEIISRIVIFEYLMSVADHIINNKNDIKDDLIMLNFIDKWCKYEKPSINKVRDYLL